jgi:hypothetical protein
MWRAIFMAKYRIRLALLVLGILLGVALSGTAQMGLDPSRVPKAFLSGNDWLALARTPQETYAMGVIDGLDLASVMKPQSLFWINPCVTGMSSDQIRAMLSAEIAVKPGERHLLKVHEAMYRAIWKACRAEEKGQ